MTQGHGWSLTITMCATFTPYSSPAFTGAFDATPLLYEEADLTETDRTLLWGRQFLNSFAFDDLEGGFSELAKIAGDVLDT